MFQLQQIFYPPGAASPDTVRFTSNVTVNKISITDETRCYPFKNSSDLYYYVRNITDSNTDQFSVSNDAFSNSQAKLTAYVNSISATLEVLEYVCAPMHCPLPSYGTGYPVTIALKFTALGKW